MTEKITSEPTEDQTIEEKRIGRPKGSKSRADIPIKSLQEAVELTKKLSDTYGDNSVSLNEVSETLGLQKGILYPVMGALKQYRLMETDEHGWRVTDLGKRATIGDSQSLRDALEAVVIFKDLSSHFMGKPVTKGVIEEYIRSKYRKGENVALITSRFIDAKNYIEGSGIVVTDTKTSKGFDIDTFKMAILVGELFQPENDKEIIDAITRLSELADSKGLKKFSGFVEVLKLTLEGEKDSKRMREELNKVSKRAKELFKNELGISNSEDSE